MEDTTRSSYSVYAQIMQWERKQRLAEYKQQEEQERFLTQVSPSRSGKKTSTFSRVSQPKFSGNSAKNSSPTRVSGVMILVLGWLMGIGTYWAFAEFSAYLTANPAGENMGLLRGCSSEHHQFNA